MPDTDPSDNPTSSTTETTPAATVPEDGAAPPPTVAPRRRRATAPTAAPKAAKAEASTVTATEPVPDGTGTGEAADAPDADGELAEGPAPRKRAPRKRAPRKAAAEPAESAVEDDPRVAEAAADDTTLPADALPAAPAAPAGRARKAPAVVPFQAPETDDADAETAPAPRRRRPAGTQGAVSPAELVPTLLEPESIGGNDVAGEGDDDSDDTGDDEGARETGEDGADRPRRRRRGRRGRGRRPDGEGGSEDGDDDEQGDADERGENGSDGDGDSAEDDDEGDESASGTRRRRRRRRRGAGGGDEGDDGGDRGAVVHVREPRQRASRAKDGGGAADEDSVRGISGSTRMAAKRVRRQEGRDSGRRRQPVLSEAEFLARRESVDRVMVVRQKGDRTQIAVLEDGVLVEHYVTRTSAQSFAGNVYLGRVQNVLPSMEAAFVDIGKGRNAVLYAGEVNWAGVGGGQRKIETHLKSGQEVLVQVSKDPMGHKGARLTGQISLPGRYLVYVPEGSMTGISRKLPEKERDRLKTILKKVVPDDAGVIIRTAAEGASEEEISADVRRLQAQWEVIRTKAEQGGAPKLLHAEPDLVIRVIRDVFNEDFRRLVVQGDSEWETIRDYVEFVAPDLAERLSRHTAETDVFAEHRIDEQIAKALDRKVYLPSGGSLVIDRTEAMVVIDVNTGKYVGKGGNLEETVTRNNLEAAEEIARQLRLRDLGGIIVVDFIDMVLESNRDLVVRRLVECMARDRTKHQVAEVTSLGLVQMTRKRVGQGLLESFSEPCERCNGRGVIVSTEPVDAPRGGGGGDERRDRGRSRKKDDAAKDEPRKDEPRKDEPRKGAAKKDEAKKDEPSKAAAQAETTRDTGEDADDAPAPGRRRRSGRGTGAATTPPEDEVAELLGGSSEPEPEPQDSGRPAVVPDRPDAPAT
ncbi:MAG: Rne/Rng family ribonuclease, partial [Actinomycetes bacterium]